MGPSLKIRMGQLPSVEIGGSHFSQESVESRDTL